jgi:hypothetical protein
VILREEHRLRVLENRVLRRICGSKRDEIVRGCRKLHNDELYNLYLEGKMDHMGMAHSTYGEKIGFSWESQNERDH